MTVQSLNAAPLPTMQGCCAAMGATTLTPATPDTAVTDPATAGGGGTGPAAPASAPAADMATAIRELQQAVEQLSSAIQRFQAVRGGGAVAGATAGAGNVGQAPPDSAPQQGPTTPAPAPAPEPPAAPPTGAAFKSAPLTVKGQPVNDEQRENIRLVLEKGKELGVSDKVATAAVATVIVESTAHNYPGGDLDSVGLFQQRDSWGSFDERHDPKTAAGKFYERATNYANAHPEVSVGDLSQKVQVSAYPDRYAEHEAEAAAAVAAFKA